MMNPNSGLGNGQGKYTELPTTTTASPSIGLSIHNGGHDDDDDEHGDMEKIPIASPIISSFDMETMTKGVFQEPAYRDKWFGIAFLIHLGIMIALRIYIEMKKDQQRQQLMAQEQVEDRLYSYDYDDYNKPTGKVSDVDVHDSFGGDGGANRGRRNLLGKEFSNSFENIVSLVSLFLPILLVLMTLRLMKDQPTVLIRGSICFILGFFIIMGMFSPSEGDRIFYFPCAIIFGLYTVAIWNRIPFAASILKAAVTSVHSNIGILIFAILTIPVYIGWIYLWVPISEYEMNSYLRVAVGLSFLWTWNVLGNLTHTTYVGTIASWWLQPEEGDEEENERVGASSRSCCGGSRRRQALTDSLLRSFTYSFGSICLGSLLESLISLLRSLLERMGCGGRNGLLSCLAQGVLSWIERIATYFNKWALVYVGIYGYSYMDAGKNVTEMFQQRGWTNLIADSLIYRLIFVLSILICCVNVTLCCMVLSLMGVPGGDRFGDIFLAFLSGFAVSRVTLGSVPSAVDTIMVLFAESPAELKENHPTLFHQLEQTWSQTWPNNSTTSPPPIATASTIHVV